jgi:HEAT repeat protein
MQSKKDVKKLIKAMGSKNEKARKVAAQELLRLEGVEIVPALITALKTSSNIQVRFHAAQLLGDISLPETGACIKKEVVEVLMYALQDKEDTVRINAVTALGKQGDTLAAQKILSLLVAETNPLLRFVEVQALRDIGTIEANHLSLLVLTMLVIINDESHWPATREGAENALSVFRIEGLFCLEDLMKHEDPLISFQAKRIFSKISKE